MKSVAVVGAGLAGLSAALELARCGAKVTVLEALSTAGGRAQRLQYGAYRFDAGPTLLVMTDVLRATLGDAGFKRLGLRRLEPGYRVFWPDGERFDLSSDLVEFLAQIARFEGPLHNAPALRYLARVHDLYVRSRANILDVDHTAVSFVRTLLTPGRFSPWAVGGLRSFAKRHFRSTHIVDALTFQPLYLGTSPRRAPALYAMLAVEEAIGGVWYCAGGTAAVVGALFDACVEAGVRFEFDSIVKEVRTSGRTAHAVVLENATIEADGVVITADREAALTSMFAPSRSRRVRYGHSAMLWYVALRRPVGLPHHAVFLPSDPWRSYAQLDGGDIPTEPLVYACNPAVDDTGVAPPGCSALTLLAPVPNELALAGFDENALFDAVLAAVGRQAGALRDDIEFVRTRGPREFAGQLRLMHGAAFGPDHTLDQMGAFRPSIQHPKFDNVVFAGSGTHPGSGVPMVLLSGRMAASRLIGRVA